MSLSDIGFSSSDELDKIGEDENSLNISAKVLELNNNSQNRVRILLDMMSD